MAIEAFLSASFLALDFGSSLGGALAHEVAFALGTEEAKRSNSGVEVLELSSGLGPAGLGGALKDPIVGIAVGPGLLLEGGWDGARLGIL